MVRKAAFFIDGYNLYHSLEDRKPLRKYKWLNIWRFSQSLLLPKDDIAEVNYFTAYTYWNEDRVKRHKKFVSLNEKMGCNIILGKFFKKDRTSMVKCNTPCVPASTKPFCKKHYIAHEEKMTDVNIAVNIVTAAALNRCESIYLISGDNDMLPALQAARQISPNIRIRLALPINAKAKSLISFCKKYSFQYSRIKERHLSENQFDNPMKVDGVTYNRPEHWI